MHQLLGDASPGLLSGNMAALDMAASTRQPARNSRQSSGGSAASSGSGSGSGSGGAGAGSGGGEGEGGAYGGYDAAATMINVEHEKRKKVRDLLAQRLQPHVIEGTTLCDQSCNPTRSRLQPHVIKTATLCDPRARPTGRPRDGAQGARALPAAARAAARRRARQDRAQPLHGAAAANPNPNPNPNLDPNPNPNQVRLQAEERQERLLGLCVQLLRAKCGMHPSGVVLLLDNVQWMDEVPWSDPDH